MKVCKIWDAEYPWDVRVEKVASALTAAGHDVHLVARNRDGRLLEERLPECTVHRLASLPGIGARPNAASMFPAFCNPRWLRRIREVAKAINADVLLCRDLPLAPTAIAVSRELGIPVVLDMAENYPAMTRATWDSGRHKHVDWLIRNPTAVAWVERWCIRHVDHILVVVEESRDRLARMGVPADRLTIVSNTPPLNRLHADQLDAWPHASGRCATVDVVYLGLLEIPRGISTLIDAVAQCRSRGLPARLTLLGEGRDRSIFEEHARRLQLGGEAIRFLGYVPYADALRHVARADVGAIPHYADESWSTTIPNKLFDYMAAGIAVLASDAPPVQRIVRSTECGEVFRSKDAHDAAHALQRLGASEYRSRCGIAGREAIATQYHWEVDAERLVDTVERVGAGAR